MANKDRKPLKNETKKEQDKMSFDVWFDKQVKAKKVRASQQRELSVFFKEKGLSESEYSDKYSETLKLY